MTRNKYADFASSSLEPTGRSGKGGYSYGKKTFSGKGGALAMKDAATKGTKRVMAGAKIRQGISAIKANPGKAGMALAGLAAAGGLGMAGMKAIGARKKKANSLQGRLSSAMKKMGR